MNVVIIEDEKPAAEKLMKELHEADASIKVSQILNSVAEAVLWFKRNPQPNLVFMDIELTDGLSFKIFELCNIECPVIFTTAYDDYWQEAFEHNSIDYLLKPVKQDKLEGAFKKY
jgi:two-component system LytT family response regulator